ncbi:hypothetical protein PG994_002710 [Apiospora phragmitis]|uniref:Uncharacterized protein n=1 Tax=Apiospora phragmitis TaxID=2905665 RepID=A0ABR1W9R2_9PEZI
MGDQIQWQMGELCQQTGYRNWHVTEPTDTQGEVLCWDCYAFQQSMVLPYILKANTRKEDNWPGRETERSEWDKFLREKSANHTPDSDRLYFTAVNATPSNVCGICEMSSGGQLRGRLKSRDCALDLMGLVGSDGEGRSSFPYVRFIRPRGRIRIKCTALPYEPVWPANLGALVARTRLHDYIVALGVHHPVPDASSMFHSVLTNISCYLDGTPLRLSAFVNFVNFGVAIHLRGNRLLDFGSLIVDEITVFYLNLCGNVDPPTDHLPPHVATFLQYMRRGLDHLPDFSNEGLNRARPIQGKLILHKGAYGSYNHQGGRDLQ